MTQDEATITVCVKDLPKVKAYIENLKSELAQAQAYKRMVEEERVLAGEWYECYFTFDPYANDAKGVYVYHIGHPAGKYEGLGNDANSLFAAFTQALTALLSSLPAEQRAELADKLGV